MRVTKRPKKERQKNPDEIEFDAFAEDGQVVVQFGDSETVLDPAAADRMAEMIADAAADATEEEAEEEAEEEEGPED